MTGHLLDADAYAIPELASDDVFRFSPASLGGAALTSLHGLAAIIGRTAGLR